VQATFEHTFVYELVTLFVVLGPFSTVPIFLASTAGLGRADSLKVGAYAAAIAFVGLIVASIAVNNLTTRPS
jgi:small neutral amino acid transporter SnatA (MarC family)